MPILALLRYDVNSPPRVGLKRVCFLMKAWYFTVASMLACALLIHRSPSPCPVELCLRVMLVVGKRTLRAEEFAGDVELLAPDDDDLLAIEQLLGHSASQATEQMSLAVDNDLFQHSRSVH